MKKVIYTILVSASLLAVNAFAGCDKDGTYYGVHNGKRIVEKNSDRCKSKDGEKKCEVKTVATNWGADYFGKWCTEEEGGYIVGNKCKKKVCK